MVEVCEYFRFYGSAQAEAQKEDAASNRRCEPCLSHLGFDKYQLKNQRHERFALPSTASSLEGEWHRCAPFPGPGAPLSCPTPRPCQSGSSPQLSAQWGWDWATAARQPALPGPPVGDGPCTLHGSSPPGQCHIERESDDEQSSTLV